MSEVHPYTSEPLLAHFHTRAPSFPVGLSPFPFPIAPDENKPSPFRVGMPCFRTGMPSEPACPAQNRKALQKRHALLSDSIFRTISLSAMLLLFFFTLVTGPRRSLSLKLSDTRVYEPQIRARLGTTDAASIKPTALSEALVVRQRRLLSEIACTDVALSPDDVFQETSARYRALEPEQWLQRHPEAGSSWPGWPKASQLLLGGFLVSLSCILSQVPALLFLYLRILKYTR